MCELCNKNHASIHITKIVNGKIEEKHLCEACAKTGDDLDLNLPFSFNKIFAELISSMQEDRKEVDDVKCSQCGLSYKGFLKQGKFACANCFRAFDKDLDSLFKGIHGHSQHMGKIPLRSSSRILDIREIESLKRELQESIVEEKYERAALLRDEIKIMEEKLGDSGE